MSWCALAKCAFQLVLQLFWSPLAASKGPRGGSDGARGSGARASRTRRRGGCKSRGRVGPGEVASPKGREDMFFPPTAQWNAARMLWVGVGARFKVYAPKVPSALSVMRTPLTPPTPNSHHHTGIVCENMRALGANLRKLSGQAKICTPSPTPSTGRRRSRWLRIQNTNICVPKTV